MGGHRPEQGIEDEQPLPLVREGHGVVRLAVPRARRGVESREPGEPLEHQAPRAARLHSQVGLPQQPGARLDGDHCDEDQGRQAVPLVLKETLMVKAPLGQIVPAVLHSVGWG